MKGRDGLQMENDLEIGEEDFSPEAEGFIRDLKELPLEPNKGQLQQFIRYYELLTEWNKVMNLTAITGWDEVVKKHFVDSLSLVKACRVAEGMSLIDVGTGAGFPGLPLKIAFPCLRVTLLDSLNKRVNFLNEVIGELGLTGIEAIHGRAEDLAVRNDRREKYDLSVSRAVANLSTLSEYCLPFVKVGGLFVSYKSGDVGEELERAARAVSLLGGKVVGTEEFFLPSSDIARCLVVIKKERSTPKKYPRKAGLPGKEPL